jgi:predicted DNA-binding transcriptional regulator AlpA
VAESSAATNASNAQTSAILIIGERKFTYGEDRMYLRKREVAALLRCHPVSVMRLVRKGALPQPIKLTAGGPCLFKEAEIQQALAHRETVRLGGGHNASAS